LLTMIDNEMHTYMFMTIISERDGNYFCMVVITTIFYAS